MVRYSFMCIGICIAGMLSSCSPRQDNALQPFFKPEISGATYAAPKDGHSNITKIPYDPTIVCTGADPTCIDMDGTYEGWGFVDNGATLAAPKFVPVNTSAPLQTGDPTVDDK